MDMTCTKTLTQEVAINLMREEFTSYEENNKDTEW
jgi:hypothetical protein